MKQQKMVGKIEELYMLLPRGENSPLPSETIRQKLNISGRTFRDLCYSLVVNYGIPLVCTRRQHNSGYYIATEQAQVDRSATSLEHQASQMMNRADKLRQIDLKQSA